MPWNYRESVLRVSNYEDSPTDFNSPLSLPIIRSTLPPAATAAASTASRESSPTGTRTCARC
jgi:hypothetical protein